MFRNEVYIIFPFFPMDAMPLIGSMHAKKGPPAPRNPALDWPTHPGPLQRNRCPFLEVLAAKNLPICATRLRTDGGGSGLQLDASTLARRKFVSISHARPGRSVCPQAGEGSLRCTRSLPLR